MDSLRNFGFLLKDLSRLYSLNFERNAKDLKLTLAQCKVLCYLERNEGICQARLAYLTDTDPMTLVRIVDRMERNGLIERKPDPADRRVHRLFLRSPAMPVLREIWRHSDRARAETLSGLSPAERARLVGLMSRLHSNLARLVPDVADTIEPAPKPARSRSKTSAVSART